MFPRVKQRGPLASLTPLDHRGLRPKLRRNLQLCEGELERIWDKGVEGLTSWNSTRDDTLHGNAVVQESGLRIRFDLDF